MNKINYFYEYINDRLKSSCFNVEERDSVYK